MPVVKQVDARHLIRDALVLDLGDLRRQAQEIIDDAERRAAALLADAGAEAKRLVDGAHAEGHAAGLEQGRADGLAEGRETGRAAAYAEGAARSADVGAAWAAALDHWERHRAEMLFAAREDVVALATAIAEKVIFRAVAADPTIIEDQLAEALALLVRPTSVVVAIHPDDRAVVEAVLPELCARLPQCEHVRLVEQDDLARGGCIVRTQGGRIDASIEQQITRIAATLVPLPDDPPPADAPADAAPEVIAPEPPASDVVDGPAADEPDPVVEEAAPDDPDLDASPDDRASTGDGP